MKCALAVGDELVVRIELRVVRDMKYIHLKDQRGSGTASHFFISYLPKWHRASAFVTIRVGN